MFSVAWLASSLRVYQPSRTPGSVRHSTRPIWVRRWTAQPPLRLRADAPAAVRELQAHVEGAGGPLRAGRLLAPALRHRHRCPPRRRPRTDGRSSGAWRLRRTGTAHRLTFATRTPVARAAILDLLRPGRRRSASPAHLPRGSRTAVTKGNPYATSGAAPGASPAPSRSARVPADSRSAPDGSQVGVRFR